MKHSWVKENEEVFNVRKRRITAKEKRRIIIVWEDEDLLRKGKQGTFGWRNSRNAWKENSTRTDRRIMKKNQNLRLKGNQSLPNKEKSRIVGWKKIKNC